jgi:hypothetical protein
MAQREPSGFFGPDGSSGVPQPGYRAINHDPATGRTYAREADYLTPKQAQHMRPQRIKQPRR